MEPIRHHGIEFLAECHGQVMRSLMRLLHLRQRGAVGLCELTCNGCGFGECLCGLGLRGSHFVYIIGQGREGLRDASTR